jgi:hypothetical protein
MNGDVGVHRVAFSYRGADVCARRAVLVAPPVVLPEDGHAFGRDFDFESREGGALSEQFVAGLGCIAAGWLDCSRIRGLNGRQREQDYSGQPAGVLRNVSPSLHT